MKKKKKKLYVDSLKRKKEEAVELLKKWDEHFPISETVDSEYARELVYIMENQRLMNETLGGNKIDLQLIFDIYSNIPVRHLVSIQTLLGPADLVHFPVFQKKGSYAFRDCFGQWNTLCREKR